MGDFHTRTDSNGWHHFFWLGRFNLAISQRRVWGLGFSRGRTIRFYKPSTYFWSVSGRWFTLSIEGREAEAGGRIPFWIF